ncbi:MAG: class I SAM-dependent methyltransferase [Opitutales bacterium]|nr:class I SAM-dependent methyltransferase [Opitutales bacterium]
MDPQINRRFFSNPDVVLDYARAAVNVGLWRSERMLIERYIPKAAKILELGAGAGRVSRGLALLGYKDLTVSDFSELMIDFARGVLADVPAGTQVCFAVEDATALSCGNEVYDAAIFAFNGLQMIPRRECREQALKEIARVLKSQGILIFTGHDRLNPERREYWERERKLWDCELRQKTLDDFGDYHHFTEKGEMFIHAADPAEMRIALEKAGFEICYTALRSEICEEPDNVKNFSDDTRFWVLRKK